MFHPLVESWFLARFGGPTEPQRLGWPHIAAGRNTLIAAPTGSGKTLAAFLVCLDRLFRRWLAGDLIDAVDVVYVSPLKALSNDIHRNLEVPLAELAQLAAEQGLGVPPIRTAVRTGDTPPAERAAMLRRPPHILVTTPESLFIVLTSPKARQKLLHVKTVIVDEIHALARDKRGSHLSLTLERLDALCETRPTRIGLSATQRPIDDIARFLIGVDPVGCSASTVERDATEHKPEAQAKDPVRRFACASGLSADAGSTASQRRLWQPETSTTPAISPNDPSPNPTITNGHRRCVVIDTGHVRDLDLDLEVPPLELEAVCSGNHWGQIYGRLVELIQSHHSTLVFVNTRRMAERIAHNLTEILGADAVASHHGSLSRELRHTAEQRLKAGTLQAIVATASLEMGIDVGYIDLVCQIGSPRAIATFVQRVGRSGHSLGALPKGRLFPLTRDELIECLALLKAVYRGELDRIEIPESPLDILAQQITAAVACDEWAEDELYDLCRRAWPFRHLSRQRFDDIVQMLHQGVSPRLRRGTQIFRDAINRRLRPRPGARLAAVTSGGAIPEQAVFRVVAEPEGAFVGTVEEDFAVESYLGDIFLLGNTSWRIKSIRGGELVVEDAHGAPPNIPFWLGEAPGRTIELSSEVSRLRTELAERIGGDPHNVAEPAKWLATETRSLPYAAEQAVRYVAAQIAAVGVMPATDRIVLERFFDESGGMQVVIHAPLGSRINRAWGLTLRKRFCRSFDFELQASADDDGIVLSVGPQHSFPLDTLGQMLNPNIAQDLLEQALLAAPMFKTRWRWNATRALAVLRHERGKRVPPHLQRFRADDLLAGVFPECAGCFENHHGDMPIPDHPLVRQTIYDCLHEATDIDGFLRMLSDIQSRKIDLVTRDTREPSPFCYELLNASPYAFLDPAPAEERRTRAVSMRRGLSVESLQDLGRLDPEAIAQVREQAWPTVRGADELHDALMGLVAATEAEVVPWRQWFDELVAAGRATRVHWVPLAPPVCIAAERWPIVEAAYSQADFAVVADPAINLPSELSAPVTRTDAYVEIARGRIQHSGPITASALAAEIGLDADLTFAALEAVEASGIVLRGHFTSTVGCSASTGSNVLVPKLELGNEKTESRQVLTEHPTTAAELEWCDRRLLARIHRLTLEGLRRRIEPVSPTDFLRFLSRHHGVLPSSQRHGPAGVKQAIAQLQGFESPAAVWESQLVAGRVAEYDAQWLDQLFMAGELVWGPPPPAAPRWRKTARRARR